MVQYLKSKFGTEAASKRFKHPTYLQGFTPEAFGMVYQPDGLLVNKQTCGPDGFFLLPRKRQVQSKGRGRPLGSFKSVAIEKDAESSGAAAEPTINVPPNPLVYSRKGKEITK